MQAYSDRWDFYDGDMWDLHGSYSQSWIIGALFLFFLIIIFVFAVLYLTGDSYCNFPNNNNVRSDVFNVTVAEKSKTHPYYGQGSNNAFYINGIQGRTLRLVGCKTYRFNVNTPGYPLYFTTNSEGGDDAADMINIPRTPIEIGTFTLTVNKDLPQPLYYQCTNYKSMGGRIIISNNDSDLCGSTKSEKSGTSSKSCKNKNKAKYYKQVEADTSIFYDSD